MARTPSTSPKVFRPRKRPTQTRAKNLYSTILETAEGLFREQGFANVSTNKIAEQANISIGSLYQYFANAESIALAIYEEASTKSAKRMKQLAVEILDLKMEVSVPMILECLIDIFADERYALLHLISEVPELRRAAQPISFDSLIHHATKAFLEQNFSSLSDEEIERKVYVAEKAVIGTIRRYMEDEYLENRFTKKEIVGEVSSLVTGYLQAH